MINTEKLQVSVGGMACSFCTTTIEKALGRLEGVETVHVSLAHEETLVEYDPLKCNPTKLRDTLRQIGYTIRNTDKILAFEQQQNDLDTARRRMILGAVLTFITTVVMVGRWVGFREPWFQPVMITVAHLTTFIAGWHILSMAVQALRRGIFNQHVLLEFGAFAGLAGGWIGVFNPVFPAPDFFAVATYITTYHLLSGWVSLLVRTRASESVRALLALQPATARKIMQNGELEEVLISTISPGDRVKVLPGESLPVDGIIVAGNSSVDESLITGEPVPVRKSNGDSVTGGSINKNGVLTVKVLKVGKDSFLAKIARHINEARAMKPGILALVDIILSWFVPGVLIFGGLSLIVWTLGLTLAGASPDWTRAIFAALAVLVMGYPCALGMSTPLAIIRGGGEAAKRGILIRSGDVFQILKDIKWVILDKTGTITEGHPSVVDIISSNGTDSDKLLQLAASVEIESEHPLASAIVSAAKSRNLDIEDTDGFEALPGKGAKAAIAGEIIIVGSPRFFLEMGFDLELFRADLEILQSEGKTVVVIGRNGRAAGLISISDTVKEDAESLVSSLKLHGLQPVMLTGDNRRTVEKVASQVGIIQVYAEVLPWEKSDIVHQLQQKGDRVIMVGDGINDAPALMQADIGIAIGAGTDIAIEAADIILTGSRLSAITEAFIVGRSSYRKTVQNLWIAFSFNGIGVPLAASGLVQPVWAMAAMVASVSLVLINSFTGGGLLTGSRRSNL